MIQDVFNARLVLAAQNELPDAPSAPAESKALFEEFEAALKGFYFSKQSQLSYWDMLDRLQQLHSILSNPASGDFLLRNFASEKRRSNDGSTRNTQRNRALPCGVAKQ